MGKHGGGNRCQETIDPEAGTKCNKLALSQGKCFVHGGGKRCDEDDCGKGAVRAGKCYAHGGAKKKQRIESSAASGSLNEPARVPAVRATGTMPQTRHRPLLPCPLPR